MGIYHIWLIHFLVNGHLACFHFIAILYEHCVQTFVWMYVSILGGHIPRSGLPGGSVGKYLPAMWEIWVQSLGWEDPLEEGTATHSSTLAWRISVDRGAWRATVRGVAKSGT